MFTEKSTIEKVALEETDFINGTGDNLLQAINPVQQKNAPIEYRLKLNDFTQGTVFYEMLKYYDGVIASPFEYIVNNLLVISGGVIGKWRYFNQGNKKLFFNLYSIIIGNSSTSKKTTSINAILKDLSEIEESIKAKNELTRQSIEESDTKNNHSKKLYGEFLQIPSKITEEAIFEILGNNSRGFQTYSEFKSFTSNLEKSYNNGFKAQLTDIYDGNRIISATKSGGEINVSEPFLSILGATTIEWLNYNGIHNDLSSGFLNRFIFCRIYKNTKKRISLYDMASNYNNTQYYDCKSVFQRLYNLEFQQRAVQFTDGAIVLLKEYESKLSIESERTNNDVLCSFYERLNASVAKISGIISLINNHEYITESDAKDAIILGNFYKHNIKEILSSGISNTKLGTDINKVISFFKSDNQQITKKELTNMFSNDGTKHRDSIIETLLQMDKIEETKFTAPNSKKPTTAYRYISD